MIGRGMEKPSTVHQHNSGVWAKMSMAVEGRRGTWWGLESIMGGQHFFSSAVGLQGFCGVDILRQIRLAPHHGPLFSLFVLQLRDGQREVRYHRGSRNLLFSLRLSKNEFEHDALIM